MSIHRAKLKSIEQLPRCCYDLKKHYSEISDEVFFVDTSTLQTSFIRKYPFRCSFCKTPFNEEFQNSLDIYAFNFEEDGMCLIKLLDIDEVPLTPEEVEQLCPSYKPASSR